MYDLQYPYKLSKLRKKTAATNIGTKYDQTKALTNSLSTSATQISRQRCWLAGSVLHNIHICLYSAIMSQNIYTCSRFPTRMWANAQRDGRPAKRRWRPLFNAAKFGWRLLLDCRAVTLPRRETRWNMMGCPTPANWSQPLVGRSSPYCKDICRRYCCLTSFFPIVDTCLSCEDIARQSCAMVPRWRSLCIIFKSCISSEPLAAHFRPAFKICTKATPCVEVW